MAARRQILIVEDDPGTMDLLSTIVRQAGYEPILARWGRQALDYLEHARKPPGLILLDLMMKEMDGWSVLAAIKSHPYHCHLPVIIISARDPREDPKRVAAHAGQYEAYLVKPFEVHELVTRIGDIINREAERRSRGA